MHARSKSAIRLLTDDKATAESGCSLRRPTAQFRANASVGGTLEGRRCVSRTDAGARRLLINRVGTGIRGLSTSHPGYDYERKL